MFRRRAIIAGSLALLASAGAGIFWIRKDKVGNDPYEVGQQYLSALLHSDADEVWRLADHHEFEYNGMSKNDLQRFLTLWLRPRIGRVDGNSYDSYGSGSNGFQTYSWGVATMNGRVPLAVSVAKTDDGLRVVLPLTSILATFAGLRQNGLPAHGGEEVMQCYWQNGLRLAKELKPFHFTMTQSSPSLAPISIEDFALRNRDSLFALRRSQ